MSSIGKAARVSGIGVETIRYYERAGIVPPPLRTASGRRVYGPAEIGRLKMIRRCRDLGFPLAEVRLLLSLAENGDAPCSEVKSIAERHLDEVRRKQQELAALERDLTALIESCAGGDTDCPALSTLASG